MSSHLRVSKDRAVQDLIGDVPFLATGVLAFAIVTLCLIKRRMNQSLLIVVLSAFFAFVAAIIDTILLVEESNGFTSGRQLAADIAREIILATSITLRFLFFWHIVAQPSRAEAAVVRNRQDDSIVQSEMHSGSWTRWGIIGLVLKYFMLTSVIAVGVLEALWRIGYAFWMGTTFAPISSASSTLEIGATTIFALKLLGNLIFMPSELRRQSFIDWLSIFLALLFSVGVAIGDMIVFRFSDYPLGRLLQGFELYVLLLFSVVVAFDDRSSAKRYSPFGQHTKPAKKADGRESFGNLRPIRTTLALPLFDDRRPSAERIASWVSRRISGRLEPEASRSLVRSDIELGNRKAAASPSDYDAKTESIYSYYTQADLERTASLVSKSPRKPQSLSSFIPPQPVPPLPMFSVSRPSVSGAESPVYGLNGVIGKPGSSSRAVANETPRTRGASNVRQPSGPTPAQAKLRRAQEDLDRSVASLRLQDPDSGRSTFYSNMSASQSAGSPFSLGRFPIPPPNPLPGLRSPSSNLEADEDEESGVIFDLVPPRPIDAARQTSFPSTTRGSDTSALIGTAIASPRDFSYEGREITSFIGGAMARDVYDGSSMISIGSEPAVGSMESAFLHPRPVPRVRELQLSASTSRRTLPNRTSRPPARTLELDAPFALPLNPRPTSNPKPSSAANRPENWSIDTESISGPVSRALDLSRFDVSPRPAPTVSTRRSPPG